MLSLGVVLVSAAFVWFNSFSLRDYASLERERVRAYQRRQLDGLLGVHGDNLKRMGELIPALNGVRSALAARDMDRLTESLQPHWYGISLEMDIEFLAFFDGDGRELIRWYSNPVPNDLERQLGSWSQEVNTREEPLFHMLCWDECMQFAVLPVLHRGDTAGTVVLGRLASDLVLGFNAITGADLGLLAPARDQQMGGEGLLPAWGLRVVAITNALTTRKILRAVSRQAPMPEGQEQNWLQEVDGRFYDIAVGPLTRNVTHAQAPLVVMISDVSAQLAQVQNGLRANLVLGIVGLLVSEALLLALLWAPTSRIRQAVSLMPLLSRRAFQELRRDLPVRKRRLLDDETDVLHEVTAELADELETLDGQVRERTRELDAKVEELDRERERYALAAEGANDGLWDWDVSTNQLYMSPRSYALLGLKDERPGPRPEDWWPYVVDEDRLAMQRAIVNHLRGKSSHLELEYRVRYRDGSLRWVLMRGLAIRDEKKWVYRMAGSLTDITHRREVEEQLRHDAIHDGLTGLPNRTLFLDRLGQVLRAWHKGRNEAFAVMFLDLDHFKFINDSYGHGAGDELLIQVADRLMESLRPGDSVARIGGDEFTLLLHPLSERKEAERIAERILESFKKPIQLGGQEQVVEASIGIALDDPEYTAPEEMLRDADTAMYRAKSDGRRAYRTFDPSMHKQVVGRLQMENELRIAIDEQQLSLYYQPIVNVSDLSLSGFEALVRWQHPSRGLVSPGEFIPVAEESGLIVPMGEWIYQEACRQLAQWREREEGAGVLSVNINISARQLGQEHLIEQIVATVAGHGIPPGMIKLELTETALMENLERASRFFEKAAEAGLKLCVDDFGTGYSSLGHLRRFPFDVVKLDRSFITGLGEGGRDARMVRAIAHLVHEMDKSIVAEGVEEAAQMEALRAMDCEMVQGYLFSRPLPAEQARDFIGSRSPTLA